MALSNWQLFGSTRSTVAAVGTISLLAINLALIANVTITAAMAALTPPIPKVTSLVITSLDADTGRAKLALEFPKSTLGSFVQVATDGPTAIDMYLVTRETPNPTDPMLTLTIPTKIDIELTSKTQTSVVLEDIQILLLDKFNVNQLAGFLAADTSPQRPTHIRMKVTAKTNVKLLGITFPFTLNNRSIDLDLAEPAIKTNEELEREARIKAFDYTPRLIEFKASPDEKEAMELHVVQAIPAALLPSFLTVSLPETQWNVGHFDATDNKMVIADTTFAHITASPFVLNGAKDEIRISLLIRIEKHNVKSARAVLAAVRDKQLPTLGILAAMPASFTEKHSVGLVHWLSDFILTVPLARYLDQDKKAAQGAESNSAEPNPVAKTKQIKLAPSAITDGISVKLVEANAVENGGKLHALIKINRSFFDEQLNLEYHFLRGTPPPLHFSAIQNKETLLDLEIRPESINNADESISLTLVLTLRNFPRLMRTGMRLGGAGSSKLRSMPEFAAITGMQIVAQEDNVLSQLASVFNVNLLFGENGIASACFAASSQVFYTQATANAASNTPATASTQPNGPSTATVMPRLYNVDMTMESDKASMKLHTALNIPPTFYVGRRIAFSWDQLHITLHHHEMAVFKFAVEKGVLNLGMDNYMPYEGGIAATVSVSSQEGYLDSAQKLFNTLFKEKEAFASIVLDVTFGQSNTIHLPMLVPCLALLTTDHPAPPSEQVTRHDFLDHVKNSVIQLASFQAPTAFLHVRYPDGNYCPSSHHVPHKIKIVLHATLPVLEANLSVHKAGAGDAVRLLRVGNTEPLRLVTEIVDGAVCFLMTTVLPAQSQDDKLSVRRTDDFAFAANEIPVHATFLDTVALIQFVEAVSAKHPQMLTMSLGSNSDTLNFASQFINMAASFFLAIPIAADTTLATSEHSHPTIKTLPSDNPVGLKVDVTSADAHHMDLTVQLSVPDAAFVGIQTATHSDALYEWPVVRWGKLECELGIDNVVTAKIGLSSGQLDIKEDGTVLSALRNLSLSLHLAVDRNVHFGSTAVRQLVGTLRHYLVGDELPHTFYSYLDATKMRHTVQIQEPHGAATSSVFSSRGATPLKALFTFAEAVINRAPVVGPSTPTASASNDTPDRFEKLAIRIKSVAQNSAPLITLACLVPAFCTLDDLKNETTSQSGSPLFDVELENVLQPATDLISETLVPLLQGLHFHAHPSHVAFTVHMKSRIIATFMLNGAGLATATAEPLTFSRSAPLRYPQVSSAPARSLPRYKKLSDDADVLKVRIALSIPPSIVELRQLLSSVRFTNSPTTLFPPAYFAQDPVSEKTVNFHLGHQPMHIAFGNDYNLATHPDTPVSNLCSSFAAAALEEIVAEGLNLHDAQAPKNDKQQDNGSNETIENLVANPDKTIENLVVKPGAVNRFELAGIASCLTTGWFCSTCANIPLTLLVPFPQKIISLLFPSVITITLKYKEVTIISYTIDSPDSHLIVSHKGIRLPGTLKISFGGLGETKPPNQSEFLKSIANHVFDESSLAPLDFEISFGDDVRFASRVSVPLHVLGAKLKDLLKYIPSFWPSPPQEERKSDKGITPATESATVNVDFSELHAEEVVCLPNNLEDKESQHRLAEVDFARTVLLYRDGLETLLPNKPARVFLQLRTAKDLQICGLPSSAASLFVALTHIPQPYVEVISLFSSPVPNETTVYTFKANFNHQFSVFEVDIRLPFTGSYAVSVHTSTRSVTNFNDSRLVATPLPYTVVYVKNEF